MVSYPGSRRAVVVAVLCIGAAGCGSDDTSSPPVIDPAIETVNGTVSNDASSLDGFSGELIINRQRDLIDRGLINVFTHNRTGHDLHVTDRQLIAEHFTAPAAEPRNSLLLDGADVAIQVPYGTATDCTTDTPVSAVFRFSYTIDDSHVEETFDLDIGGTEILDGIRAKQCAAQTFDESTDAHLTDPEIVDGTLRASLEITRTRGDSTFAVERMSGTILVGIEPPRDFETVTIDTDDTVTIPFTFVVIRCDPHALAEVTKRYGLDLDISIDGAPAQPVPIDVSELTGQLEAIVQECRDA